MAYPPGWGGRRKGAGRKPVGVRAGVPHRRREAPSLSQGALHLTLRVVDGLPNLRTKRCMRALWCAFAEGKERFGFRLCHFAVQRNHLHLIAEVDSREALMRGMRGLTVRIARKLNAVLRRKGRVMADRYHAVPLTNLRQLRNALAYVLNNHRRHLAQRRLRVRDATWRDPCSSAWYFDGFDAPPRALPPALREATPPVVRARGWPLRTGWRRAGLVAVDEIPATKRSHESHRSLELIIDRAGLGVAG